MFKMLKRIVTVFLAALLVANMTLTVCLPAEAISQTVSKTTTVSKKAALKITKQPVSVTKPSGVTSKVSVTASGDGLTYTWYVKNAGATKFTVSSVKTNTYSVKMSSSNANRQVYCVVKDKYGKSVKTNTVTLKMGKTLTITKQLASVTAHENYMATVSFVASGDALSYAWYVKNADATSFTLDKSVTGTKYSVTMTEAVNNRQVYCVITDAYGLQITTNTATLSMSHEMGEWELYRESTVKLEGVERSYCAKCEYYEDRTIDKLTATHNIIVNPENGQEPYLEGVAANGKYELVAPKKTGYNFVGFKDADGNDFALSGTVFEETEIFAYWTLDGTDTLQELIERTDAGVGEICITADIEINTTIFISAQTKLYANTNCTLSRAANFTGDMFVIGHDRTGQSSTWLGRETIVTLGDGKGTLTIDGNKDNVQGTVKGSAFFVTESATVNICDGIVISNHKKLGNERSYHFVNSDTMYVADRAGGAAILNFNSVINMYGGIIENNEVYDEPTIIEKEDGSTEKAENYGCGGAIYTRGNFNMYGGIIRGNHALRGGGIYNERQAYIFGGEISENSATTYGGAISSSSSMNSNLFIGEETGNNRVIFKNNSSTSAGGAIYSNTTSPIVIYGNTEFLNNSSEFSGGAIYTAGALTISNTLFNGNTSSSSGGAIYHHYQREDYERRYLQTTNCEFINNVATYGGAITLSNTGTANTVGVAGTCAFITDCAFNGNQAVSPDGTYGSGGAMHVTQYSEADVTGCTFTKNVATNNAGAVSMSLETIVNFTDCDFAENEAANGGATLVSNNATVSMKNVLFEDNKASNNGGALNLGESTITFNNVDFISNEAGKHGGALYQSVCKVTMDATCSFDGNTAGEYGGAVYASYKLVEGTGEKLGATFNATGVHFTNNSALAGGAISARTATTINLTDVLIKHNIASGDANNEGGGAIFGNNNTMTLTNVRIEENQSAYYGGAIAAMDATVTINGGSVITNNVGVTGAALQFRGGGTYTLDDITITNHNSETGSGVIYITNTGTLNLNKVTATGNSNRNGGVIYASGSTNVTIQNSTFDNNTAFSMGGAVYADAQSLTITNSNLTNNTAHSNAGAVYVKNTETSITDVVFDGNRSVGGNGGALDLVASDATVIATTFKNNSAVGHGGALYVTYTNVKDADGNNLKDDNGEDILILSTLNLQGGSFENNTAASGGAISARTGAEVTVANTTFDGNKATSEDSNGGGGAIYANNNTITLSNVILTKNETGYYGGAMTAIDANVTVNDKSQITSNIGTTGAAFNFRGLGTYTLDDVTVTDHAATGSGVVYITNTGTLNLNKVTATGNSAVGGGAVYASGTTTVNITDSTLSENTTTGNGGALYATGIVTVQGTTISGNRGNIGGAINMSGGTLMLDNSALTENSATSNGGAIYVNGTTTTIKDTTFTGNNSSSNGGAIDFVAGEATISGDTTFKNNTAVKHGGAIYLVYTTQKDENDKDVTIPGTLTMNGGLFEGNSAMGGGAVSVRSACTANFNGTQFIKNSVEGNDGTPDGNGEGGGAIYVGYGNLNLTDVTALENTSSQFGGAIDSVKGVITITGGSYNSNTAADGGAIYGLEKSNITISGAEFKGNSSTTGYAANVGGGAINLRTGSLNITGSTFDGNSSGYYGGAVMADGATVSITDNSVFKNNTGTTGAVMTFRGTGTYTLDNISVIDNTSSGSGVIYITNSGTLDINKVTATGNTAVNGAVVYASGTAKVNVTDSTFTGNTATTGGGVLYYSSTGAMTITNPTFTSNSAKNGGAIFATSTGKIIINGGAISQNTASAYGGAVYLDKGAVCEASSTTFEQNEATKDGGAIYVADTTEGADVATTFNATGATFKSNVAQVKGGALSTDTNSPLLVIEITDSRFESNSAVTAGGGAVEIQHGNQTTSEDPEIITIVFKDCEFVGNTCKTTGGAIEIRTSSAAKIDGMTATNNAATGNGGVVYVTSNYSRLYLTGDVIISGNTAASGSFGNLYNTQAGYSNPPKIYTTHSNSAAWYSELTGNKTNVEFDMISMP